MNRKTNFSDRSDQSKRKLHLLGKKHPIFAETLGKSKIDKSAYASLYQFNSREELAEYSLPFYNIATAETALSKLPKTANKLPGVSRTMQSQSYIEEDKQEYSQIEEEKSDKTEGAKEANEERQLDFQDLKRLIEENNKVDANSKVQNLFLEKGTKLYDQWQAIKTGEQAIEFFAKYGNTTAIKFINCNRAINANDDYRPYDLVVIHQDRYLKDEHFTISAQDVVHICPEKGANLFKNSEKIVPTETYSLSNWMRQSTMFNVLRSMSFFNNYINAKVFTLWKGTVRYFKFVRVRAVLENNLIYSRQAFAQSFVEIGKLVYQMDDPKEIQKIFAKQQSKNSEVDDFSSEEKKNHDDVKMTFDTKIDEIAKKISDVVENVKKSASIKDEDETDKNKLAMQSKQKSMVKIKEEQMIRKRCIALSDQNLGFLTNFVRLIDYINIEKLYKINQDYLNLIINEMRKERKFGILIKVNYAQVGMVFTHSFEFLWNMFSELITHMKSSCVETNRINNHKAFDFLLQFIKKEGPNMKEIIENSLSFKSTSLAIKNKLDNDMESAQKFVNNMFEKYRDVYEFNQAFNFEEFKKTCKLEDTTKLLTKLKGWKKGIKTLKSHTMQGIIYVDCIPLIGFLSKVATGYYESVRKHLIELTEEKGESIIRTYENLINDLEDRKVELNAFCTYIKLINKCKEERNVLKVNKEKLEEMFGVVKKNRLKNDTNANIGIQFKLDEIEKKRQEFDIAFDKGIATHVEVRKAEMETQLNTKVAKLKEDLTQLITQLDSEKLINPDTNPQESLEELNMKNKKYLNFKSSGQKFNDNQQILEMPVTNIKELAQYERRYEAKHLLWDSLLTWREKNKKWYESKFSEVDVELMSKEVKEYDTRCENLKMTLSRGEKKDAVVDKLNSEVKKVVNTMGIIEAIGNKALKAKHWKKIFALLQKENAWSPDKIFTLNDLLGSGIINCEEQIKEISATASGEYTIELTLIEIKKVWAEYKFTVLPYRDLKERYILGAIEEVNAQLEDDQMKIQTMMGSKNVVEIRDEVEIWEKKLSLISEIMDEWVSCQKKWMYLENIFSAEDIQKQLPQESTKFQQTDKFWRDSMSRTNKNRIVAEICSADNLLNKFQSANNSLEDIQKSLENYLETKRSVFPRFYFLSNDELIEILSKTRNVQAVQPHLKKCFDNIHKIEFTTAKHSNEMIAMQSGESEKVKFSQSVIAEGNVEFWMLKIEAMMRKTIYDITKKSLQEYPENGLERRTWFFKYPAQAILTVDLIMWTTVVQNGIITIQENKNPNGLIEVFDFIKSQINKMVELARGELDFLQRQLIEALIVLDVHGRDVVSGMSALKVKSINDFDWTRQLRYYWEEGETDDCVIKQTNTRFRYGYEYLGNQPRLVITPLTDKCYMTLTGALHLNYGGNPQGPAGTGKTETTKDLAKALAIQCVVFNCSDGLDYKTMGQFFSGLAQGGAWSCFDEFNRIDIEVLSVIAQQILTIQKSVRAKLEEFEFEGKIIPLNPRFGVFITMNPGYAGRTELPDNLKALFRPISMMIPDYAMIAEIILFSQGFSTAQSLARKMVQLYKLSSEQLSKQSHYDFGMRAVKSVLVMAGTLRRRDASTSEDIVLIRAMRDSNVPKFLSNDLPLFTGIVNDLFPGVVVPNIDYGQLEVSIKNQLDKEFLQKMSKKIRKFILIRNIK